MALRAYKCTSPDSFIFEVEQPISVPSHAHCPLCGGLAKRHFGGQSSPLVNYGYRGESHYATKEDARIAQYQFEHL